MSMANPQPTRFDDPPDPLSSEDAELLVPLDNDAENWMQQHRLAQLRARGWTGSTSEWIDECERLGSDPLEQTPPITSKGP